MARGKAKRAAGFWMIHRQRKKKDSAVIHGIVEISADVLNPFCVSVNAFILILDK